MNLPIDGMPEDQRHFNEGRPSKLSSRSKRSLIREIPKVRSKTSGKFTLKDLRDSAAIPKEISNSTVSRVLYSNDYKSRPALRKGVLTEQDCKIRLKFAKHMKKVVKETFWTEEISFYFDGAGFLHKKNPCEHSRRNKSRTWRKSDEGGNLHCTTSGRHEGTGGKTAKFMVAIAYEKGVTMCEEYCLQLNGASFADFIKEYFPPCFKESGNSNLFLQDGDPSQNSRLAMDALAEVGGQKFAIPARSPDLNPIENVFHLAKRRLKRDAEKRCITNESYEEYVCRVKETICTTSVTTINNIIDSMNRRIDEVIKKKGQRIRY